jgi:ketosteroid isomerase-like protein
VSTHTLDENVAEIRTVIERWAASVQRCDIDGVLAGHGSGVVMFDVPPPENGVRGLAAYASAWPAFLEWVQSGARFEIDELHVDAGVDATFAWALLRCGTDDALRSDPDRRLRLSFGLRRRAASWAILHEHHSFAHP